MPGASSSVAPPKNESRLSFDSGAFHYEVSRPLVSHPDYDTLLLARRQPFNGGPRRTVILRPVDVPPGSERRARAREEVKLEAAKELASILEAASSHKRLDASSIERGVLPTTEKSRLH
ncbi:MAG TPA: hypothetical protein VLQ93_17875 [Myxococcaceae bacterium]|nr:hypothetical protein [Myxococcaceae bacterium]